MLGIPELFLQMNRAYCAESGRCAWIVKMSVRSIV